MRTTTLAGGETVPCLGLGTWRMGEQRAGRAGEVAALRLGIDLGMTLIDTAEMYGEGGAEEVVGEAIAGRRDGVFVVSKVYPHNASRAGVVQACERSLRRLGTDRIDLYLLHWRGSHPLSATVDGFAALQKAGKIRHWGVSNLDVDDMAALAKAKGGDGCAANQVLYNLGRRGIEWELLPSCRRRGIAVMAYTPLEPARLKGRKALAGIAAARGVEPLQVALAWTIRQAGVIAIPKASDPAHVRLNRAAADILLTEAEIAALDTAFPPPTGARPLEML